MAERTFAEWIDWFEKKSGEKFRIAPGFNLEYRPDKGFFLWKKIGEIFAIDQGTTEDWEFWGKFIVAKGTEIGCKRVRTTVRRDAVSYARLTGGRILLQCVDEEGRLATIVEWDTLPEALKQ